MKNLTYDQIIEGLKHCTEDDCQNCPVQSKEYREKGIAACRAFEKQSVLVPIDLLRKAIRSLEKSKPNISHWEYKERHRKSFHQYTGFDKNGETHTIIVEEESEGHEPYCANCGAQAAESWLSYCPKCGAVMKNH